MVGWLMRSWDQGADYAHGYIVPFVAVGLIVWKWRKTLHAIPMSTGFAGIFVVLFALLLYWVGARSTNPRLLAISMVFLIFGSVWYVAGWRWAKEIWFACAFLLFMIPLNFLEPIIAFPLRMFVSHASVALLNLFGMEVIRDGTAIRSLAGHFEPLDVADPCSGIRSLVALMALTAIYGYVTMDRWWKKWLLFASSMPLAVIGNMARITTIALVAQGFGQELATTIYHDYSGYIVFSLAILSMIAVGALMNIKFRDIIHHWMHEEVHVPRPAGSSGGSSATKR
jgi:exosortase